jgi:hypothetical protein
MALSTQLLIPVALLSIFIPIFLRVSRATQDENYDIPGPFLARFTRLWFLRAILKGDFEKTNIELHRKHGPIVRIGPNLYSFNDASATALIYGSSPTFPKSKWYSVFQPPGEQFQNIYSSGNNKFSTEIRKKYKPAYDALQQYEYCVDECSDIFIAKLKELSTQPSVNIGWWLNCYALDVNGQITFGKRFGHLDSGEDVGGIKAALEERKDYGATVGIFPGLHEFTWKLISLMVFLTRKIDYTLVFTQKRIEEHKKEMQHKDGPTAMITRYLDAHNEKPEYFTYNDLLIGALTGIVAGADTTEIALGALFHYLQENPEVMKKLREELKGVSDPVSFSETKQLPYLNACVKETQRMHSSVGTPLWRTVPEPGYKIAGRFFPAGTDVGVNIWVSQHSGVFDPDPDAFRPERWIEADEGKLREMERAHISFGLGPRNCQGENIAMMQMLKIIPRLVNKFDFEFTGEWKTKNNWFVNVDGLVGKIKVR